MKKIELTKGKFAIVDDDDFERLSQYKWCFDRYARRSVSKNGVQSTIRMHREIIDIPKGMEVDHINQDKLDNRKENLRLATRRQQMRNRPKGSNNTTGYKGVTFNKGDGAYRAAIKMDGKTYHLGNHKTAEEAARAYARGATILHGEFASSEALSDIRKEAKD